MTFLAPGFMGLLAFAPVIVLFHLVTRRRQTLVFPSLLILKRVQSNSTSSLRIKRLLSNLEMWLQILAVVLVALFLSQPILGSGIAGGGGRLVVVVDVSAGMAAGAAQGDAPIAPDAGESRLAFAARLVAEEVRRLSPSELAVVAAGRLPRLLVPFGEPPAAAHDALEGLEPTNEVGDIDAAVRLASGLAGPEGRILIYSDQEPLRTLAPGNKLVLLESNQANAGITTFRFRERYDVPGSYRAVTEVRAAGGDYNGELTVYLDGEVRFQEALFVPAGGVELVDLILEGALPNRAWAELSGNDAVVADNTAYTVLSRQDQLRVLLLGDDPYLRSALFAMDGVEVQVPVDGAQPRPEAFDLVVSVGIPIPEGSSGSYLVFGAAVAGMVDEIRSIQAVGRDVGVVEDPLTRGLSSGGFRVQEMGIPVVDGRVRVVARAGGTPAIVAGENDRMRAVILPFFPSSASWIDTADFPLFLSNAVRYLSGFNLAEPDRVAQPGASIPVRDIPGTDLVVRGPDGSTERVTLGPAGGTITNTSEPGFYVVEGGSNNTVFAVSLTSTRETVSVGAASAAGASSAVAADPAGAAAGADDSVVVRSGENTGSAYFCVLPILVAAVMVAEWLARRAGNAVNRESVLRAVALVLVIAGAVGLQVPDTEVRRQVIFLADVSAGMSTAPGARARTLAAEMARQLPNHDGALVLFGGDAVVAGRNPDLYADVVPPRRVNVGATNLEAGLLSALSLSSGVGSSVVVLVTDGRENVGDARIAAQMLARADMPVHVLPVDDDGRRQDVLVSNVAMPSSLPEDAAFTVDVVLEGSYRTQGELFLSIDGESVATRRVELPAGTSTHSFRLPGMRPGFYEVEVSATVAGDQVAGNNYGGATMEVAGPQSILLVSQRPSALSGLLDAAGVRVVVTSPSDIPADRSGLAAYDTIVFDDVPAYRVSLDRMDAIESFVRDMGGGFLMLGGTSSFGAGGYSATPIEDLLPVDMDVTASLKVPSLAMLFVIDRSGSMGAQNSSGVSKLDLVKEAVLTTVEIINPVYRVGVLAFDADYEWTVPLIAAGEVEAISESLSGLETGGGTILYDAMEEAFRNLNETPAAAKHVIVLSDGLTSDAEFDSLVGEMLDSGITVSTVSIGSNADRELMRSIAHRGGGRSYVTRDVSTVPRIFTSETTLVTQDLVVEERFVPSLEARPPFMQAVDTTIIPPLDGFVLTYAKPNADIVFAGPGGNPILSVRRYGLGRSAAFTSDFAGLWSDAWLRWDQTPTLMVGLLRALSSASVLFAHGGEGGGRSTAVAVDITTVREPNELLVEADIVDASGSYLVDPNLELRVVGPDGFTSRHELVLESPGRYRAQLLPPPLGTSVATIGTPERGVLSRFGIVNAYPGELRPGPVNGPLLRDIAGITGGSILGSPADVTTLEGLSGMRYRDLSGIVVLIGFLLFFAELSLYYVRPTGRDSRRREVGREGEGAA